MDRNREYQVRIIVVGPGRAGGSLAVAAHGAGHEIVGIFARRRDDQQVARHVGVVARLIGEPMPEADLIVVAVRDDAVPETARALAGGASPVSRAVHLSGLASVGVLDPLRDAGLVTGSFHPLQTLPDWRTGSRTLRGAYVGITAGDGLAATLDELAHSLGCHPFRIADEAKPLYHAAAAASANYVLAALAVAETLFRKAGVAPRVARPLVVQVVANAFDLGIGTALTGPIARGDTGTVRGQLEAVDLHAPRMSETFRAFARTTATVAGTGELMEDVLAQVAPRNPATGISPDTGDLMEDVPA